MRKFQPLVAGHPALERSCAACGRRFEIGEVLTLVVADGRSAPDDLVGLVAFALTVEAVPVHWDCRLVW